jgi:hypothetical protein
VPLVYFVGTRPNWYRPIYPTFVERDEPAELRVLLTFGKMPGPYDAREAVSTELGRGPIHASPLLKTSSVIATGMPCPQSRAFGYTRTQLADPGNRRGVRSCGQG